MLTWLSRYRDAGLLLLRVGLGIMMFLHGFPKLKGGMAAWEKLGHAMGNLGIHFAPAFWGFCSGATEAIGGLMLIIGLWFRPVTILMSFNFVVATMMVYQTKGAFQDWSRPAEMLIVFVSLIFIGAGKYSVDRN